MLSNLHFIFLWLSWRSGARLWVWFFLLLLLVINNLMLHFSLFDLQFSFASYMLCSIFVTAHRTIIHSFIDLRVRSRAYIMPHISNWISAYLNGEKVNAMRKIERNIQMANSDDGWSDERLWVCVCVNSIRIDWKSYSRKSDLPLILWPNGFSSTKKFYCKNRRAHKDLSM